METIIDRLVAAAGRYEGTGDGSESGPFGATIEITSLAEESRPPAHAPDGSH